MELVQQAGSRAHIRVDLHGWGERGACGEGFTPSPLPHPFTLPRTYVHRWAGSPSTAVWTGRPAGRSPRARSPPRTGTRR